MSATSSPAFSVDSVSVSTNRGALKPGIAANPPSDRNEMRIGSSPNCASTTMLRPPELVDVAVRTAVDDVLGALRVEHVARGRTSGRRRAGGAAQVAVMPAGVVPPELVDVA